MGSGDFRAIAKGLIPTGFDASALPPKGRDEVRLAIDALIRLLDRHDARLSMALGQLDRAADEIERLKAELRMRGRKAL